MESSVICGWALVAVCLAPLRVRSHSRWAPLVRILDLRLDSRTLTCSLVLGQSTPLCDFSLCMDPCRVMVRARVGVSGAVVTAKFKIFSS